MNIKISFSASFIHPSRVWSLNVHLLFWQYWSIPCQFDSENVMEDTQYQPSNTIKLISNKNLFLLKKVFLAFKLIVKLSNSTSDIRSCSLILSLSYCWVIRFKSLRYFRYVRWDFRKWTLPLPFTSSGNTTEDSGILFKPF